jgi:hypothetical protein
MAAIDWTYLARIGGEGIEDFAATCLRQRYDDALQTQPASGDGGIDVFRDTQDGLIVWQIKKFTSPLTTSQKQQVKRSWKRFWDTHVAAGRKIKKYYLATPWTPTDGQREWFNEVTRKAAFPTQWDGAAFFDGLAAEFPATADRFFKVPELLENMVNAKAMLAASPVESADSAFMMAALAKREAALREIRDLASDNYFIDTGTRSSSAEGELPFPATSEAGIFHRFTYLSNNRFYVESVVPRNSQSAELEPISLDISFIIEPGTDDAQTIEDWRLWGIPFQDLKAETCQRGGPFGDSSPRRGSISFVQQRGPQRYPDLQFTIALVDGVQRTSLILPVTEVTHGINGGGVRVVAVSESGILQVELRMASNLAPNTTFMQILPAEGLNPAAVRDELRILAAINPKNIFTISVRGGPVVAKGTGFEGGNLVDVILPIAVDLADLQTHTTNTFVMPEIDETTVRQAEVLHHLAEIYRGTAHSTRWERLVFRVEDPERLRADSIFSGRAPW